MAQRTSPPRAVSNLKKDPDDWKTGDEPLTAAQDSYLHTLAGEAGETVPEDLEISARTEDGQVMGLRHRRFPIEGVQFHPESILTLEGKRLLANFLGAPAAVAS